MNNTYSNINIKNIIIKDSVRNNIKDNTFNDLKENIKVNGILQPIGVYKENENDLKYILLYGERRLEACKELGHKTIPAILFHKDFDNAFEVKILENINRKDLSTEEISTFIKTYLEKEQLDPITGKITKMNLNKISKLIGKSRSYVTMYSSIANTTPEMKTLIKQKKVKDPNIMYNINKAYQAAIENNVVEEFKSIIDSEDTIKREFICTILRNIKEGKPLIQSTNLNNNFKIILEYNGDKEILMDKDFVDSKEYLKAKSIISTYILPYN